MNARLAAPSSPPPSPAPPSPAATEIVHRPDPGLARGKWEAPAWAFWVALGAVALVSALYVAWRAGALSRAKKKDEPAPTSKRRP